MTTPINIPLNLQTGDTLLRLQRMALDSQKVRDSWRDLPGDVRLAHREMLRLGEQQVRTGHLRAQERRAFLEYRRHVELHHERVRQQMEHLRTSTTSHPLRGWYDAARQHASPETWRQFMADPGFAGLHAEIGEMSSLGRQDAAMSRASATVDGWGVNTNFDAGAATQYWGRRVLFGTDRDGTPRSAGHWALNTASNVGRWGMGQVRGAVGSLFDLNPIARMHSAMRTYEESSEAVQEFGAKMGTSFDDVRERLHGLRREWKYTHAELVPGLREFARSTGTIGETPTGAVTRRFGGAVGPISALGALAALAGVGAGGLASWRKDGALIDGSLGLARAMGLSDPTPVMQAMAHARRYGQVDVDLYERSATAAGMRSRKEPYLDIFGAAQTALGQGFLAVPEDAAARYAAMTGMAMGEPYQNQRGVDFVQRLVGGVQSRGGSQLDAMKYSALRGLGRIDVGGGMVADTGTYVGMQMALESGAPEVLAALFRESQRLGGKGDMGTLLFQKMLGGKLNTAESKRMFEWLDGRGGKTPTRAELARHQNFDDERGQVQDEANNPSYKMARIKADVEAAEEEIGGKLLPTAMVIKDAVAALLEALAETGSAIDALSAAADVLHSDSVANTLGLALVTQAGYDTGGVAGAAAAAAAYKAHGVGKGIDDALKKKDMDDALKKAGHQ